MPEGSASPVRNLASEDRRGAGTLKTGPLRVRFWTVLCGLFNGRQRSLNRLHDPYGNGLMLHNLQRRSTSGLLQAITIRTLLPCAHSTGRTVHTYTTDTVTERWP